MSRMIKTKASLVNPSNSSEFKHIKFEKKSLKTLPKTAPPKVDNEKRKKQDDDEESDDSEFERIFGDGPKKSKKKDKKTTFESARREIINYGIAGSNVTERSDLSQQLAVKLGAKPAKNVSRNYKDILEEKRKQKFEVKVDMRKISGSFASHQLRNQKKSRNKAPDGLLKQYGRVDKRTIKKNSRK